MINNEEIAKEIALDFSMSDFTVAKEAALEMAERKDKQFKEYLEKKRADIKIELRKNMSDVVNHSFSSVELALINEIINELFPESEELDNSNKDD